MKDLRNWELTRLAHEGIMLDKILRQNKIVENTVKGLQSQGGMDSQSTSTAEEDDMGVSIGNEHNIQNHYHQEPTKTPTNWLPASVLAAGALAGAGLFFGGDDITTPIPAPNPVVDTDVGVGFGEPQIIPIDDKKELISPTTFIIKENLSCVV